MTPSAALIEKQAEPLTDDERARMRALRIQRGWSYREMAGKIGIPESTLTKILKHDVITRETTAYVIRRWLASREART